MTLSQFVPINGIKETLASIRVLAQPFNQDFIDDPMGAAKMLRRGRVTVSTVSRTPSFSELRSGIDVTRLNGWRAITRSTGWTLGVLPNRITRNSSIMLMRAGAMVSLWDRT